MKKFLMVACLFALFSAVAVAQDEQEEPKQGFDKSKLFFGGNFGLGFGNVSTLINVSPQIGYRFNRYLAAGAGINFIYSSYKYQFANPEYKEQFGVAGLNRKRTIPGVSINFITTGSMKSSPARSFLLYWVALALPFRRAEGI
jgi:hypothetical protein